MAELNEFERGTMEIFNSIGANYDYNGYNSETRALLTIATILNGIGKELNDLNKKFYNQV